MPVLLCPRVLRYPICSRHPRQLRLQASCPTPAEAVATALSPHATSAAQLSFRHRARSWPRQRRICYKAEHSAAGTADRLSCHRFLANAFRLLLHAAAYNLVNFFRRQLPLLWRSAQIETLRAKLFKIGARVRHTARCVRFHLATGWPFQNLFRDVAFAVNSS